MPADEFMVVGEGAPALVALPGWATDGRIFAGVFPGGVVTTRGFLRPDGFPDRLASCLRRIAPAPVTVVGWSLGGFLAAEFAGRHPDLVRRLVLVGIRRRYPAADLEGVRERLLRDRRSCLADFHAQCFFPTRMAAYRRFRSGLLGEYLREADDAGLLEGLSYLAAASLSADVLPRVPVSIVHGEKDVIAPCGEAEALSRESGRTSFRVLEGAPHAAFLEAAFPEEVRR